MATEKETGGPAFPSYERIEEFDDAKGKEVTIYGLAGGMTLRDYFAGQALKAAADSICDQLEDGGWSRGAEANDDAFALTALQNAREHADRHAMSAYMLADAMLKARST